MTGRETFKFYHDPGHGWLAVKYKYLVELGIADKITFFSYQKGLTVYLEEDCDATTFVEAYKAKFGHPPKHTSVYHATTPIRSYSHYHSSGPLAPVSGLKIRNSIKNGQIITLSPKYKNRRLGAFWRDNTLTGQDENDVRYRLTATNLEGATVK